MNVIPDSSKKVRLVCDINTRYKAQNRAVIKVSPMHQTRYAFPDTLRIFPNAKRIHLVIEKDTRTIQNRIVELKLNDAFAIFRNPYTGRANMGDAEKYIESFHVYSSGTKGISLQMMSVGDTFTIDMQQNFESRVFADALLAEAARLGLTAHCSDVIRYTTPKDHTSNTNFIKSLIGLFKKQ